LTGGVDASTHAVRLEPGGWVVLKRSWTVAGRSLAEEFERLVFAQSLAIPTPTPVAVDEGDWFGRPALVMSRLPGRSGLRGAPGRWVTDLAEALAAIHDVVLPADLPGVLRAPHAGFMWRPPEPAQLRRTARVERLFEVALQLQNDLTDEPATGVLLHHDFHHGNVTWRAGRLVGVLDWNEARIGPADSDVAYCSVDLAMTHGAAVADQFSRAYQAAAGRPLDDLLRWQALWIANDMRWISYWVTGFHHAGADHLTVPLLRRRLRTFADHVLARL
jgi:aminoglycoside phosphotransferase (APT) family kinase protein